MHLFAAVRRRFSFRGASVFAAALVIVLLSVPARSAPPRVLIISQAADGRPLVEAAASRLQGAGDVKIVPPASASPENAGQADIVVNITSGSSADGVVHALTAFDTTTGIRLQDAQLPQVVGQVANDAVEQSIRAAVRNRRQDARKKHLVALLSARSVDLPADQDGAVDAFAADFSRALFNSRSISVLERGQLGLINDRLTEHPPTGKTMLRLASTLLWIDVAKLPDGAPDQIQVTATLISPTRVQHGTVTASGSLTSAPALAQSLAQKVQEAVDALPAAVGEDASAEAAQFARECTAATSHQRWEDAAAAADAAVAIAPSDGGYRTLLANALISAGVRSIDPYVTTNLPMVNRGASEDRWDQTLSELDRGSRMLLASGADPSALAKLDDSQKLLHEFCIAMLEEKQGVNSARALARADERGKFSSPTVPLTDVQSGVLSNIIWNERNYIVKVVLPQRLSAIHDNVSFQAYTASLMDSLGDECHIFSKTQTDYVASATRQLIDWAPLAAELSPPNQNEFGAADEAFQSAPAIWVDNYHQWHTGWRPPCFGHVTVDDAKQWEKVADALEQSNAPMRLYINLRNWARSVENPQPVARAEQKVTINIPFPPEAPEPADEPRKPAHQSSAEPAGPLPLLYSKSTAIIDSAVGKADPYCINKPLVVGDQMYVAVLGDSSEGGYEMRLMSGPIDASKPLKIVSRLSHVPEPFFESCRGDGNNFFQMTRFLGAGHFMLSSFEGQIFVLTLGDGGAAIIDASKELPGQIVQSAADLGDVVYMVVANRTGATFLLSYDLHTRRVETLASSARSESISPFDNIAPMSSSFIWADPPRDRIVFFAYQSTWNQETKGVWEFNVKTRKFRRLLPTSYDRKENGGGYDVEGTPVVDGKFMLMTGETLVYDLAADAPVNLEPGVFSQFESRREFPKIFGVWWKRFGKPGGSGVGSGDNTIERRTGGIHSLGDLWQGGYPMFTIDVPPDQLLVADWSGIWLLTPNP